MPTFTNIMQNPLKTYETYDSFNAPLVGKGFLENHFDHLTQIYRDAETNAEFRYFARIEEPSADVRARMIALAYVLKAWEFTACLPLQDAHDYADDLLTFFLTPIVSWLFSAGQFLRAAYELGCAAISLVGTVFGYSDFEEATAHASNVFEAVSFGIYSAVYFGVFASLQCMAQSALSLVTRPLITLFTGVQDKERLASPRFFREKEVDVKPVLPKEAIEVFDEASTLDVQEHAIAPQPVSANYFSWSYWFGGEDALNKEAHLEQHDEGAEQVFSA